MKTPQQLPALLRPAGVCQYLSIGRTKLWQLEQTDPTFPRKIQITQKAVGWRVVDLDGWLALKAEQAAGGRA